MFLTGSCPQLRVLVRSEFLHDMAEGPRSLIGADVVGLKSIPGRALGFHVLLRNGAVFWDLPVHAICWHPEAKRMFLQQHQLWDCFSYHFTAHRFARLADLRCEVRLKGKPGWCLWGAYIWTIDWCSADGQVMDTGVSEFPPEHKCAHLLALDDGNFALLPNNRIRWHDEAFCTEPFPERPTYLTNTHTWQCENGSKPITDGFYFYEIDPDDSHPVPPAGSPADAPGVPVDPPQPDPTR